MAHPVFQAATGLLMGLCASIAHSAVLTFDDLPAGPSFFVADYQGFRFGTNDPNTNAWFHTAAVDPLYSPRSGSTYISTDFSLSSGALFESTQAITALNDFVFDGAYFSGFDRVRFDLYNDGLLVFTSADSALLTSTATFVATGYVGAVDAVVVKGTQGFYALDDFTFREVTPVPEPSSLTLIGLGLAAFAVSRRRKQG